MNEVASSYFPESESEDQQNWTLLTRSVTPGVQLPNWPFTAASGETVFCQWNDVISGDFGDVFRLLCEQHEDDYMVIATFDRGGRRQLEDGRLFPILRLGVRDLTSQVYWNAIQAEPIGPYAYSLWPGADIVAAAGTSGKWAVWAQLDWEVGIVHSLGPPGPWAHAVDGLAFVNLDVAMSVYMQQALGDRQMMEEDKASFVSNFGGTH